jgi:hypothetical protein
VLRLHGVSAGGDGDGLYSAMHVIANLDGSFERWI